MGDTNTGENPSKPSVNPTAETPSTQLTSSTEKTPSKLSPSQTIEAKSTRSLSLTAETPSTQSKAPTEETPSKPSLSPTEETKSTRSLSPTAETPTQLNSPTEETPSKPSPSPTEETPSKPSCSQTVETKSTPTASPTEETKSTPTASPTAETPSTQLISPTEETPSKPSPSQTVEAKSTPSPSPTGETPSKPPANQTKERSPQEILNALANLTKHQKRVIELLADVERRQDIFLTKERKIADFILSIDRQEKRINNQTNFLKRTAEEMYNKLDSVKNMQDNIDEEMKKVSSTQILIADEFALLKDEVGLGNKETVNEISTLNTYLTTLRKSNEDSLGSMNAITQLMAEEVTLCKNQFETMKQAIIGVLPGRLRKVFGQSETGEDEDKIAPGGTAESSNTGTVDKPAESS